MSSERDFQVRPSNDGVALATALRKMLGEEVSWSSIKTLISSRRIHVNGNLCVDEGRRLKKGDMVRVFEHSRAGVGEVVIRWADEHLVIIEKPAGVNTLRHREEKDFPQARKDKAPTVEELTQRALGTYLRGSTNVRGSRAEPSPGGYADLSRNTGRGGGARGKPSPGLRPPSPSGGGFRSAGGNARTGHSPGLRPNSRNDGQLGRGGKGPHAAPIPVVRAVHRLDRDTSGLMLFALTAPAEMALERDFARHAVERKYRAVVWGEMKEARTIESWIVRDRGDGLRGSSAKGSNAEGAQRALTRVKPIERIGSAWTLVECELETGRTHQIRIHLSEAGHPLAGEKVYTHRLGEVPWKDPSGAPRQALHSFSLALTHPVTGKRVEMKSEWPKEMAAWMKKLKANAS